MFRDVVRVKQKLSQEECVQLLKSELRGVLAVLGDDDYPYGVPTNYWYCEEDGKLYFHSNMSGHKVDAIRRHGKVSFCVFDQGMRKDGDWALTFRSVIVFGRVEVVNEHERAMEITRQLSRRFTDDESYIEYEIQQAGARTLVFALTPEHMTGKTVHEA